MMYHVQVDGKLLFKNLTRRKAMEIFELPRFCGLMTRFLF